MTKFKRDFKFNDNIIEVIAYNVIKYRKINKITQEQLAIDIGVSPEFIRKFESTKGSEGLSLMSLYKISIVLNTSIDKFFESIEINDRLKTFLLVLLIFYLFYINYKYLSLDKFFYFLNYRLMMLIH